MDTQKCRMDSLIYDVGSHKGGDTEFYLSLGFNVLSIDANPYVVQEQTERLKKYIPHQLKILNVGIADENGTKEFYINKHSVWSSFDKYIGCRMGYGPGSVDRNKSIDTKDSTVINVPTMKFSDILKEHGIPYYLKIDIEGYDDKCIRSLAGFEYLPKYISCETGDDQDSDSLLLLELLYDIGYRRFKLVKQGHHDGRPDDCSGPFGEDAVDVAGKSWHTKEEAATLFKFHTETDFWFDWHASL